MGIEYIINNSLGTLTNQTINGNLTVIGNVEQNNSSSVRNYKALLTQTGQITGTNINDFNYGLIIGEIYTITNYSPVGGQVSNFIVNDSGVNYVDGTYPTQTSGNGLGLSVDVITGPGGYIDALQINNPGQGYNVGDTFTVNDGGIGSNAQFTITQILNYDDFSNVANVINGNINQAGCQFIATGKTPTTWNYGTQLASNGGLIVDVIENNLGYDLTWIWAPFGGSGYYIALNDATGPINNSFPKEKVSITTQLKYPFYGLNIPPLFSIVPSIVSFMSIDSLISLDVWDITSLPYQTIDDQLYYTPVEITVKQDMTPIIFSGSVVSSYPFGYVSVNLKCNGSSVNNFYGNDHHSVNDITEVIERLNTEPETKYLGTYSDGGFGTILLAMPTYLANYYCLDQSITFDVFAD